MPASVTEEAGGATARRILGRLDRCVRAWRAGAGSDPDLVRAVAELHETVTSYVNAHGPIVIGVRPDGLECCSECIEAPAVEDLALPLMGQGLRHVTLEAGFTRETAVGLLDILTGRGSGRTQVDDVVTMFWRSGLPGLSWESELSSLLQASADGDRVAEKAREVLETLASDPIPQRVPPPPGDEARAYVDALRGETDQLLRHKGLRVVLEAMRSPAAAHGLSIADVRRALDAAIGALVSSGDLELLRSLLSVLRPVLTDAASPWRETVAAVFERWLGDPRLHDSWLVSDQQALDLLFTELGPAATELLGRRAMTGTGGEAARAVRALVRADPASARKALLRRLDGADAGTRKVLLQTLRERPALFDGMVRATLMGLADDDPAFLRPVLQALVDLKDREAAPLIWKLARSADLGAMAEADQAAVIEALVALGDEADVLPWVDELLGQRSLLRRKPVQQLQLVVAAALGRVGPAACRDLLERRSTTAWPGLREACERALAKVDGRRGQK